MRAGNTILSVLTITILLFFQTQAAYGAETDAGIPEEEAGSGSAVYERVIAHGGGAYKGYETTNSVEALNHSIENGYRVIELDMELSSDHKIIMLHDWDRTAVHYYGRTFDNKLSQNQFLNLSVFGEFEVLTFEKLAEILKRHPDVRIVTDTKGDNLELLTLIAEKNPDLKDRFIPQIYACDQWEPVRELGFQDIIFTLYAIAELDMEELAAFLEENDVYAVTMPDYVADRGLCRELSQLGAVVYVHPVSGYETAKRYMAQGAYGVYSGSLLPEEFSGVEGEYYLLEPGADRYPEPGADRAPDSVAGPAGRKLTDSRVRDWKELALSGCKSGDTVRYYLDRSESSAGDAAFAELTPGKHTLTVSVSRGGEVKGSLDYCLYKEADSLRILHKKYEYRLDEFRQGVDFDSVMEEAGVGEEVREILASSIIAGKGEYSFYTQGTQENFYNGEELLPVQVHGGGTLLLPLGTVLERLGASSVTMGRDRDLVIDYDQEKIRIMPGSKVARKGFRTARLKNPVVLYWNKAMASGEFFQYVTGRNYIEKDGILILLPDGVKADREGEAAMVKAAGKLFQ